MESNWYTKKIWLSLMSIILGLITVLMAFYFNSNEINLIFGVLSSQGNFEARQVIRNTWKTQAGLKDLQVFFIVGERFCEIPLLDRVCPYSCHYLQRTSLKNLSNDLSSSAIVQKLAHRTLFSGFSFKVNNKIVVDKLTILRKFVKTLNYVKVHLIETMSREKIASVTFMENRENNSKILISKSIEPYLLPKNFEGTVLMETESTSESDDCSEMEWTNGNGAISFVQLISPNEQMPIAFHSNTCSPVSMVFHLHDLNEFEEQIVTESSRIIEWREEIDLLQKKLLQESVEHNDILFVDVVDVYRNLPKKLLLFLQWLHKKRNFRHVVKVDDDTLLDVNEIEKELASVDPEVPSIWAELRTNWAVRTAGKWREDRYSSIVYPPFPCGAGYALSRAVVRYLANNADILESGFQGEDVSLGIWLSALSVVRVDASRSWSCDSTCNNGALNLAQLTPVAMVQAWAAYEKCSSFCGCDEIT